MSKEKVKSDASTLSMFPSLKDLGVSAEISKSAPQVFAQWIRALTQNWRQGTVGVKDRSDVAFSNKKPWKQKGTGRARAGSARSPLWRGGGVIFGPQERTRTLKVTKQMKKSVLHHLLHDFVTNKKLIVADWSLNEERPKTSAAYGLLKKLELADKKVVLFISQDDFLTYSSFINLPNVQVLLFDQVNAYDLANTDYWLVLKKDNDAFKEMVARWN